MKKDLIREFGGSLVEMTLLVAFIAMTALASVQLVGTSASESFCPVSNSLGSDPIKCRRPKSEEK